MARVGSNLRTSKCLELIVRSHCDPFFASRRRILRPKPISSWRPLAGLRVDKAASYRRMLKPLGISADQKGIELTADILAGVPDHLIGDPIRLRQILVNRSILPTTLSNLLNAAMSWSGSRLTPTVKIPGFLHFWVSDIGIGIDVEKQVLIFLAFTEADGDRTGV